MQVPAQTVDVAGAVPDQVFSVIHEQAQLAGGTIQTGDRESRLAKRGPRDRQGVDRVGLAVRACRVAGMSHHLGRHSHDLLAGGKQIRLESAGQMSAVLHRPTSLDTEPIGPAHELQVDLCGGRYGRLGAELAPGLIDRHHRVRAFVSVDPKDHHPPVPFCSKGQRDRSVGTPQWGRCHAPIKPRRPVSYVRGAARGVVSTKGSEPRSQPLGQ